VTTRAVAETAAVLFALVGMVALGYAKGYTAGAEHAVADCARTRGEQGTVAFPEGVDLWGIQVEETPAGSPDALTQGDVRQRGPWRHAVLSVYFRGSDPMRAIAAACPHVAKWVKP
jgi:hypothetical protein